MAEASSLFYAGVKSRPPPADYDHALAWSAIALLALGLVMVYSSSIAIAEGSRVSGQQPLYYLIRHAIFLTLSMLLATLAFHNRAPSRKVARPRSRARAQIRLTASCGKTMPPLRLCVFSISSKVVGGNTGSERGLIAASTSSALNTP